MRLLFITILLGANCLKNPNTDLILAFLKGYDVKYCFFLVGWSNSVSDKVRMSKSIIERKLNVRTTFLSAKEGSVSKSIAEGYSKVSYVLDLSCGDSFAILKESSETYKFSQRNSWLIIVQPDTPMEEVKSLFGRLKLRQDMDVKIAVPSNNSQYDIYEIFYLGLEAPWKFNKLGYFRDGFFSHSLKDKEYFQARRNMSEAILRVGNVVNFTEELLFKSRNAANYKEHGGLYTLYCHHLFLMTAELLKFRYNMTVAYPWFGPASNGTDAGLGKMLYDDVIDLQAGGGLTTIGRMPFIESITTPYMKVQTAFYYRAPGIKKPGAQVLQPLAAEVWYYVLATAIITGAVVKVVYWVEHKFLNSDERHNFFTSVMTVISVLAQQGSSTFPHRTGGRVLFLNLLIFSIWLYNYYTSGLVSSLLNSKPQLLTTFKELYESPLGIGIEDEVYIHLNIKESNSLEMLYNKKIYRRHAPRGLSILSPQEGFEKVRKGGFAYHTMVYTAYPIIAGFDQEAICDLGEILWLDFLGSMFLKKRSQYKELFLIGSTKLWENGLTKKVYDHVAVKRPECRSDLLLTAVGPQELFLVYLILIAGVFLAAAILLGEIIHHRILTKKWSLASIKIKFTRFIRSHR